VSDQLKIKPSRKLRNEIDFDSQAAVGARTSQEDYALFSTNPAGSELLAVLADGMGGHSAGEVASKRAVDSFHSTFNNYPPSSVPAKLSAALNQANNDLAVCIKDSPALSGMGCTLVGVHIGVQGIHWISVGDSPLFLIRNGEIKRLNADHSMVPVIEESLRKGKITKKEALSHPDRHALRSAVSGGQLELIDSSSEPLGLCGGDIVILASDGLLTLTESEIANVVGANLASNAQGIVSALMKAIAAKNKPKQDNTTIQIFIAPHEMGKPRSSAKLGLWLLTLIGLTLLGALAFALRNESIDWPRITELLEKPKENVTPTAIQVPESPITPPSSPASSPAPAAEVVPATKVAAPEEKTTEKAKTPPADSSPKKSGQLHQSNANPKATPASSPPPIAQDSSATPQVNIPPKAAAQPTTSANTPALSAAPAVNTTPQAVPKAQAN
jgi:protein phosphatase